MMLLFFLLAPILSAQTADTIYYNAKIVTMWDQHPVVEAVAIRGDRFLAAGSKDSVMKTAGPSTRKIDLRGKTVLPGLIDSHVHPIMAALSEKDGPIPVMNSIAEIQAHMRKMAAQAAPGDVLFIPKVYSTRLKDRRYPTRHELDAAAPNHIALTDNGYASVLNSKALARIGITRDTPQPPNGKIIKDAAGEPTGLILGAPQLLSQIRRTKQPTAADLLWALESMHRKYNEVGLTSVIDRGESPEGFRAYETLRGRNKLTVRSYVTYLISAHGTPADVRHEIERIPFVTGFGDEWFRVGSLKTVADGGILIGTAYLREPYGEHTDIYGYKDPDYRGVLAVPKENLVEMARTSVRLGWQMTAHTTGGGAIDTLLDAYETVNRETPLSGRRFTVTHGNFPSGESIARAARMGIAFDCQPQWYYFDGPALAPVFGPERIKQFQPLRTMLAKGVVVAGGSDHMIRFDSRASINAYNPYWAMWMTITRKTADGSTLNPGEALTREQALRLWTLNGAYLSFEEKTKGSIEPGKLADMVVISEDYLTCPVDHIKDIEALLTVVGGKVVYSR
ncbi:MAG: N-substituted formamide deformylase [Bryobacteraceae bacterium]|nr:N-substituted formamide deformylase [Bryobacteraceae bacterium]